MKSVKQTKMIFSGALGNFYNAPENCPPSTELIIDDVAVVQSLNPRRSGLHIKTKEDYAVNQFIPYTAKYVYIAYRTDVR